MKLYSGLIALAFFFHSWNPAQAAEALSKSPNFPIPGHYQVIEDPASYLLNNTQTSSVIPPLPKGEEMTQKHEECVQDFQGILEQMSQQKCTIKGQFEIAEGTFVRLECATASFDAVVKNTAPGIYREQIIIEKFQLPAEAKAQLEATREKLMNIPGMTPDRKKQMMAMLDQQQASMSGATKERRQLAIDNLKKWQTEAQNANDRAVLAHALDVVTTTDTKEFMSGFNSATMTRTGDCSRTGTQKSP